MRNKNQNPTEARLRGGSFNVPGLLLVFALFLVPLTCLSRVITVGPGGDYSTIQFAINAAYDGDEIIVSTGRYEENIFVIGKNVTIRSTDPNDLEVVSSTIIDGGRRGSSVRFRGPETQNCVLAGFTVTNGQNVSGGGIEGNLCHAVVRNNIITGNRVTEYGGGVSRCNGLLENNVIHGNLSKTFGGGLFDCSGTIRNNTIVNNSAYYGGGMAQCKGLVRNCIVWNNEATLGLQLFNSSSPSYCCIEAWHGGGTGIVTNDPLFADDKNADFHILPSSPCIDAGEQVDDLLVDFEGDCRPYDHPKKPGGDGSGVDIGADEYAPPSLQDVTEHLLGMHILEPYRLVEADINGDGFINTADIITDVLKDNSKRRNSFRRPW